MDKQKGLEELRLRLEISNEEQDTLLTALLEDAEQYALGYTGRSVLPAALEGAVLELAILRYRRRGMEGEPSMEKAAYRRLWKGCLRRWKSC